jgi:predicted transposase/invertase (TIGR01784 family)
VIDCLPLPLGEGRGEGPESGDSPLALSTRTIYRPCMQNTTSNTHDLFFVEMFSNEEVARDLIRRHVPAGITEHLDMSSLEITSESYTDEFKRVFTDIILRLNTTQGHEAAIYLLLEHKSRPERFARLQILKYLVGKWVAALKSDNPPQYLPIIIPMIVCHGRQSWRYSPEFVDLFNCPAECFRPFIPSFRHLVHDLSVIDKGCLEERIILNAVQLAMKFIHSPELKENLDDIYASLEHVPDEDRQKALSALVTLYIVSNNGDISLDDVMTAMKNIIPKEEIMQTVADKIRAEERIVSLREGERAGELKGVRSTILDLVLVKFDHIPLGFTEKINAINDIGTLKGLSVSLVKAESLEAFEAIVDKVTRPTLH